MRTLTLVVLVLLCGAVQASSAGRTLWVAPDGDGDECRERSPCSIATGKASALAGDVVELTDGTYRLDASLAFIAADSGVEWKAAPGAHPILSGALRIFGWQPSDTARNVWSARVPPSLRTRELYVDGVRMKRASGSPSPTLLQTPNGYVDLLGTMASWRNPRQIELVFTGGNGFWSEPRCLVESISGMTIVMREPCWSNLHMPLDYPLPTQKPDYDYDDNPMGGFLGLSPVSPPSRIENAYELMAAPGQWYLDETAHELFLIPLAGMDLFVADVEAPVLERLVTADGAHDLTFRSIELAYTTWLQPSGDDGFAEMQANMTLTGPHASAMQGTCQYSNPPGTCPFAAWTKQPAAVELHGARAVSFVGDRFVHLGAAALGFDHGSKDNLVLGNEVADVSGNGILLGAMDDPTPLDVNAGPEELVERNTIADNWVHGVGAAYPGAVGIWLGYTRQSSVVHNQVNDVPYTGISVGWGGWHTDTLHLDNPNINADNLVAENLIFNYMQVLEDGGAIYTNGFQGQSIAHGLTMRANVAVNQGLGTDFVFYNDEGSSYITLDRNVEYGGAGLFANGGCNTLGHIVLDGNYWVRGFGGYICPPPPVDVTVKSHHLITDHPAPGDVPQDLLSSAGLEPAYWALLDDTVPEVTNVGPLVGLPTGGTTVLVSGSGFAPGAQVFFGGVAASDVQVLTPNYLTAVSPPGQLLVDVTVRTEAGESAVSTADIFIYLG